MREFLTRIVEFVDLIGPYPVLQAVIVATAFIIVGKISQWIIKRVFGRIAARSSSDLDDRFIELAHRPIFLTFVLVGFAAAAGRVEMGDVPLQVTVAVLKTIAIFIWYNLFREFSAAVVLAIRRRGKSKLVQTGMLALLQNASNVILFALAVYFAFLAWSIDVTAWLASAGIVGLALSFAARDTLSNLFAGVSIAADAPYKIGDFIVIESGERGVVTQIGLRSTRLLTRDDVEITIPNGVISQGKIINEAGGPSQKHRIRVAVGVAYGSDIDHVIATLEKVAADNSEVCETPAPRVRFRTFGDSSLDFELLCWIEQPVDRGRLHHELNCEVYKAFAANDIAIPFPQRDLHVRTMPQT